MPKAHSANPDPVNAGDFEEFAKDMVDASEVIELLSKQIAEELMWVFRAHAVQIRERAIKFVEASQANANDA